MASITSDDLILQLKKIFITRIQNRFPDKCVFRVGFKRYSKTQFIKQLEDTSSTIFGQFIQAMAEHGFDSFANGRNVRGFSYSGGKAHKKVGRDEVIQVSPHTEHDVGYFMPDALDSHETEQFGK